MDGPFLVGNSLEDGVPGLVFREVGFPKRQGEDPVGNLAISLGKIDVKPFQKAICVTDPHCQIVR
jgi:hypothetical protein